MNNLTPITHDVSEAKFVPGITNFTLENLFDALLAAGNPQDIGDMEVCFHPEVKRKADRHNLLDQTTTGIMIQGMPVVDPPADVVPSLRLGSGLFRTDIRQNGVTICHLITREH
jgi:hypothetical protein